MKKIRVQIPFEIEFTFSDCILTYKKLEYGWRVTLHVQDEDTVSQIVQSFNLAATHRIELLTRLSHLVYAREQRNLSEQKV